MSDSNDPSVNKEDTDAIEVYVRGDSMTPQRFWDYALRTNYEEGNLADKYTDAGFIFSKLNTDLYKSLSEEERKKVYFLYIDGIKPKR